jgi:1,4-dihydroxy-2-naphthoate octaprenyltransferase
MQRPIDAADRTRRRRRFGLFVAAVAAVLLIAGAILANRDSALGAIGIGALGYGIGLLVAGAALALGHNPLDRHRR